MARILGWDEELLHLSALDHSLGHEDGGQQFSQYGRDINQMQYNIRAIKDDIRGIRGMRDDIRGIRGMRDDIRGIKEDIRGMQEGIKHLVEQTGASRVLQYIQQSPAPPTSRQGDIPDIISDTASTLSTGSEDEEARQQVIRAKCMSGAIQCHFKEILRRIPCDGLLVDEVLAKGIVTIQENKRIREFEACDNKMRYLVRNVMSKDCDTMMNFLDQINEYDPDLRTDIIETFNIRSQDELHILKQPTCSVCLIQKRIGIKVVCDHLFSRELITDTLHRDITESSSSKDNDALWRRLFQELSKENPEHVRHIMKILLTDGEGELVSHYADIIKMIDKDTQKRRRSFKCRCMSSKERPLSLLLDDRSECNQPNGHAVPAGLPKQSDLHSPIKHIQSPFPIQRQPSDNSISKNPSDNCLKSSKESHSKNTEDQKEIVPLSTQFENFFSKLSTRTLTKSVGKTSSSESTYESRKGDSVKENGILSTNSHTQSTSLENKKRSDNSSKRVSSSPLLLRKKSSEITLKQPSEKGSNNSTRTPTQGKDQSSAREISEQTVNLPTQTQTQSAALEDLKESESYSHRASSPVFVSQKTPNAAIKQPSNKGSNNSTRTPTQHIDQSSAIEMSKKNVKLPTQSQTQSAALEDLKESANSSQRPSSHLAVRQRSPDILIKQPSDKGSNNSTRTPTQDKDQASAREISKQNVNLPTQTHTQSAALEDLMESKSSSHKPSSPRVVSQRSPDTTIKQPSKKGSKHATRTPTQGIDQSSAREISKQNVNLPTQSQTQSAALEDLKKSDNSSLRPSSPLAASQKTPDAAIKQPSDKGSNNSTRTPTQCIDQSSAKNISKQNVNIPKHSQTQIATLEDLKESEICSLRPSSPLAVRQKSPDTTIKQPSNKGTTSSKRTPNQGIYQSSARELSKQNVNLPTQSQTQSTALEDLRESENSSHRAASPLFVSQKTHNAAKKQPSDKDSNISTRTPTQGLDKNSAKEISKQNINIPTESQTQSAALEHLKESKNSSHRPSSPRVVSQRSPDTTIKQPSNKGSKHATRTPTQGIDQSSAREISKQNINLPTQTQTQSAALEDVNESKSSSHRPSSPRVVSQRFLDTTIKQPSNKGSNNSTRTPTQGIDQSSARELSKQNANLPTQSQTQSAALEEVKESKSSYHRAASPLFVGQKTPSAAIKQPCDKGLNNSTKTQYQHIDQSKQNVNIPTESQTQRAALGDLKDSECSSNKPSSPRFVRQRPPDTTINQPSDKGSYNSTRSHLQGIDQSSAREISKQNANFPTRIQTQNAALEDLKESESSSHRPSSPRVVRQRSPETTIKQLSDKGSNNSTRTVTQRKKTNPLLENNLNRTKKFKHKVKLKVQRWKT